MAQDGQIAWIPLGWFQCCAFGMVARFALLATSLVALITLGVGPATACEKHLNGHQNSAETNSEVQGR